MAENQASNAAADVEMSQYVADRTRVNEDKIKQDDEIIEQFGDYNYGWHDTDFAGEAAKKGIDENVVRAISADKHEPEWMLEKRLEGYRDFIDRPMPQWGVDLKDFDADDFKYYVKPIDKQATTWEELPDEIRSTYDKLGIPRFTSWIVFSSVARAFAAGCSGCNSNVTTTVLPSGHISPTNCWHPESRINDKKLFKRYFISVKLKCKSTAGLSPALRIRSAQSHSHVPVMD